MQTNNTGEVTAAAVGRQIASGDWALRECSVTCSPGSLTAVVGASNDCPESLQPAEHGAQAAVAVQVGQLEMDAASRPLVIATETVDQLEPFERHPGRAGCWCARATLKPFDVVGPVACHPFGQRGAGGTSFSGDVSDGQAALNDAGDETLSSLRGQQGVSVGHRNGPRSAERLIRHHPSRSPWARSFIPVRWLQRHNPQHLVSHSGRRQTGCSHAPIGCVKGTGLHLLPCDISSCSSYLKSMVIFSLPSWRMREPDASLTH